MDWDTANSLPSKGLDLRDLVLLKLRTKLWIESGVYPISATTLIDY